MARNKAPQVRRVTKNEERKRPGIFQRLKEDEKFVGFAMFEPDAEIEDNPGFFEYFTHWDTGSNSSIPCLGEDCPLCEGGDTPSTRALTLWYVPENAKAEQFKVFEANSGTVDEFVDEAEDHDGLLGKKYRIRRRGSGTKTRYRLSNLNEKLSKTEIKNVLKALEIDLEAIINKKARAGYELLKARDALEEDDDLYDVEDEEDDEDEKPKARKGRKVKDKDEEPEDEEDDEDEEKDEEEEDDETPEPIEDETFEILSVSKKNNTIKVEHEDEEIVLDFSDYDDSVEELELKKGGEVTLSAEFNDGTWEVSAVTGEAEDEEEAEEEDDDDETSEIEDALVTVVSVDDDSEIFKVKHEDLGMLELYVPQGVDPDYDDYSKGTQMLVSAVKDADGDWVLSDDPEIQEAKKPKKTAAKKPKK